MRDPIDWHGFPHPEPLPGYLYLVRYDDAEGGKRMCLATWKDGWREHCFHKGEIVPFDGGETIKWFSPIATAANGDWE